MMRQHNAPVTMQVYLGSGKRGAKLRENLEKKITENKSLSEVVVELLREADPGLFKGVDNESKK